MTQEYLKNITRSIYVTFRVEEYHRWPEAPDEVAFMRDLHRHVFHVRADIEVFHDDRDIEFILEKRRLQKLFDEGQNSDYRSCEMLGEEIVVDILGEHGSRLITVQVSEYGENGAVVRYNPYV